MKFTAFTVLAGLAVLIYGVVTWQVATMAVGAALLLLATLTHD